MASEATSEEAEDIIITAEGVQIRANETVSTGEYETGNVGATIDASVEGVDITNGLPDEVTQRLYALQRTMQNTTKAAAEERKKEAEGLK
ncbi:hypothetical protein [Natrinema sp. DC36]|uniref:hypothetical protein n=1 Tax=Natrinema sp. DC36 TaxID=2878680 RepID=UPI001CF0593A|nr:hypothetical protein [Natrinema sp. DC36]